MNLRSLNLRLLPQLVQKEVFLLDLDVIAQEERNRQLEEGQKVDPKSETLFFYPQAPDPEGRMAEDENIQVIFVHNDFVAVLAGQKRIIIPVRASEEGVAFISKNTCPLSGLKEKRNPMDISLNNSSFLSCRSLNVGSILPSSKY